MTTVKIYAPEENLSGLREITIPGWSGIAYQFSREKVSLLKQLDHSSKPAVYHLLDDDANKVYLGETDVLKKRITTHNYSDWSNVIAFTSTDDYLNKAHVKYLEYFLTQKILDANRIELVSGGASTPPNLSNSDKEFAEQFAGQVQTTMGIIGFNFYKELTLLESDTVSNKEVIPPESDTVSNKEFYCRGPDADAKGAPVSSGFLIKKDSLLRKKLVESVKNDLLFIEPRESLRRKGDIVEHNEVSYRVHNDIILKSPSAASNLILGRRSNGWTEWKDERECTLDELYR